MCMLNGKLLANAFPINKVEVFFDDLDHSNFLGFTWEQVGSGKVPVGLDTSDTDFNTIGKTGGEKTHKLTVNEMPSHGHNFGIYTPNGSSGNWAIQYNSNAGVRLSTDNTGGGQAHNNLSPYIVMAFWKRIA